MVRIRIAEASCFVDPADPSRATLERPSLWSALAILFPMVFGFIGGGGLLFVWWPRGGKKEGTPGTVQAISSKAAAAGPAAGCLAVFFGMFLLVGLITFFFAFVRPALRVLASGSWREVPCVMSEREWSDLFERLRALHWRAAIVGPEGSGKTTLLEDLARRLPARGLGSRSVMLTRGAGRLTARERTLLAGATDGDLVLVDGADQLARLPWWRLVRWTRRTAGLVVTAHRPGLLPTLVTLSTSPELLAEIVGALDGETGGALSEAETRALFARHSGNIRTALRELYDRKAES